MRVVPLHRLVIRHRDRAVLALDLFAAAPAHHGERISAPVQQNDHLLAAIERGLRLLDQPPREDLLLPRLAKLLAHVDQLDRRQRTLHHACRASRPARSARFSAFDQLSSEGVADPSTTTRLVQLRAHHRDIAPVIARRLLLLVAQSCSSSTMIRPRFTIGANTAERVPTTIRASPRRMLCHCSARSSGVSCECSSATSSAERREHLPRHRGRQPDLRHQQQRRLPGIQRPLHRGKVHRRLARSGDAIQQDAA